MCGAINSERESKTGGEVIRKGFLEDVQCKILKIENNPNNPNREGRPESGCGLRGQGPGLVCCLFSFFMEM